MHSQCEEIMVFYREIVFHRELITRQSEKIIGKNGQNRQSSIALHINQFYTNNL